MATAAWIVAIVAWGRGTWLGATPVRVNDTMVSLAIGAAVFVLVLFVARDTHQAVVRRAIGAPGPLLLLFLVLGALTVATLHRQEVETAAGAARPSGATATWLSVLAVPVVVVTLVGLAVAAAVGPVAPEIGRGITSAADHVGAALAGAGRWVWHLVAGRPLHPRRRIVNEPTGGSSTPTTAPLVWLRLVVIGAAVAVSIWQLRHWSPRLARWVRNRRSTGRPADEPAVRERRTWNLHLGSPRRWARRLWARLRRRHPGPAGAEPLAAPGPSEDPGPVRRSYRELLTTLAGQGEGRVPAETVRELDRRITGTLPEAGPALEALSSLYEAARYSTRALAPDAALRAETAARSVVALLTPEAPPDTSPVRTPPRPSGPGVAGGPDGRGGGGERAPSPDRRGGLRRIASMPHSAATPRQTDHVGASPAGACASPHAVLAWCPLCSGDLVPEHAHFRCPSCGWRDSCCD